jgi:hypothetical protein
MVFYYCRQSSEEISRQVLEVVVIGRFGLTSGAKEGIVGEDTRSTQNGIRAGLDVGQVGLLMSCALFRVSEAVARRDDLKNRVWRCDESN